MLCTLVMPFVITGLFRVLPMSSPLWLPFVLVAVAAAVLHRLTAMSQAALIGVMAGLLIWGVFLLVLFQDMSQGLADF